MVVAEMRIILYILTAVFLTVSAFVYTIQECEDLYLLIGNTNGDMIMRTALDLAVICLIIIAVIAIVKKEKHRIVKSVICFAVSGAMLYCIGISGFLSRPYTYYDFTSPDEKYTVIAGEWSWLLGGGVNFYERTNPFFVKRIGNFSTDDGYEPIKNNDYSVKWLENEMIFTANNGNAVYETLNIVVEN